jgi:dipeptidyl aminopeptidase/acylaminoacyl peptidase
MRLNFMLAVTLGVAGLCLLFVVRIVIKSYLDERADFVRNRPTEIAQHPERTGIRGLREISIDPTSEVPRLAGWYAPSSNRAAIVLIHGCAADRSGVLAETRILAQAGFGVLALDLPGQGASEGKSLWGVGERRAVSAAVDWLIKQDEIDPQRVGALGQSMGAYIVTQAAVLDRRLRAIVIEASPSDVVVMNRLATARWGVLSQWPTYWALRASGMPLDMRPKDVIGSISPRPVLIIGGKLDGLVRPFMVQELYDAAQEPKELWIVDAAHHVDYAAVAPRELRERLIDFYNRGLEVQHVGTRQ